MGTINLLAHSFPDITRLLLEWINPERTLEINNHLIRAILFLSPEVALQILLQLKEPKAVLHHVDVAANMDKSLLLHATFSTPDDNISIVDNSVLLDCGAGARGYISASFVDMNKLLCTPLPYQIPVYNVDRTLNKGGAINRICSLTMKIGTHQEQIAFRVTDTGSSNIILGLDWLCFHDPLINWTDGKLFFLCCPPTCSTDHQSFNMFSGTPFLTSADIHLPVDLNPDSINAITKSDPILSPKNDNMSNILRSPEDVNDWDSTLETDMHEFLTHELGPDDKALLFANIPPANSLPADMRVYDHIRHAKESSDGIDKYLKDFAPVSSQSGFDDLPPQRPWDHASFPWTSNQFPLKFPAQNRLNWTPSSKNISVQARYNLLNHQWHPSSFLSKRNVVPYGLSKTTAV